MPARIGRYTVAGELGSGGMGEVYLAYSPAGDPVAVKLIRADRLDPVTRARFEKEALIARTVVGTNRVARFLDADPYADRPWMAMEYVPGRTLLACMEEDGPLAVPLVASLGAFVAVWLGMDAEALIAAYRARFPVLNKYEAVTWFDADGWKVAGNARTIGQRQTKESYAQLQAHLADPDTAPPPDGYTPPFYKADREREMREAHAVFKARLDDAIARGEWDPATQQRPTP